MKLFTTNSCPSCQTVKQSPLFKKWVHQIRVVNLDFEPQETQALYATGSRSVPTLIDGQSMFVGADSILRYLSVLG